MLQPLSTLALTLSLAYCPLVHADQASRKAASETHSKSDSKQSGSKPGNSGTTTDIDALMQRAAPQRQRAVRVDPRCEALFDQALTRYSSKQYPMMLKTARERVQMCPGANSNYLLGLALAHMFEHQLTSDPAELEQYRIKAILALRKAAVGGSDLETYQKSDIGTWLVQLEDKGAPVTEDPEAPLEPALAWTEQASTSTALPFRAPPPQPMTSPPWGPVITGSAGIVALGAALVTGFSAQSRFSEAETATDKLLASGTVDPNVVMQIKELENEGNTLQGWTTGLVIGGGAAVATAALWYLLLPPDGGWQWASVGPTGVHLRARF